MLPPAPSLVPSTTLVTPRPPPPPPRVRRRLGELLIEAGVLDEVRLKAALAEQKKWGGRLGRVVVEMGFVDEVAMCRVLAQQLRLGTVDLDSHQLPARITDHLRLDLAERYGVFPVAFDPTTNVVTLATSDPTNVEALQELEFATNQKMTPIVATASSIDRAIRHHYFGESASATKAATPGELGLTETTFELDQLLSAPAASPRPPSATARPAVPPPAAPSPEVEAQLRKEIALLREQVDGLETIVTSQVRALRSLLEILIEAGLITRDEYLQRLHRGE
ncbi:MAG: general secretion pathway protein GspE [Myxococcaceae bacterium]|nr:general secretion pathway protein GspE [Myxococcaceae bacterium]